MEMDFSKILNIASNNKQKQVAVKRYSTEVSAPKKLQRGNVQSDAIKAFLRRKDEEDKKRVREAVKKKEELLSLRAAAKHNRKASAMARRTKDNNFAAKFEERNEPPFDVQKSTLRNEKQANNCRQVVDEFEDRVSSKNSLNYKSCERNKPLSISEKERIKVRNHDSSINKSILPSAKHERINRDRIEEYNVSNASVPKKSNPIPSKVKTKPPPPQEKLDFFTLLKIAKQKQHEPINIPKKKVVELPERPMTQEEKNRLLEEANHKAGKTNVIIKKKPEVSSKNEKLEKAKPKVMSNVSKQNSNQLLQERTKNSVSRQPLNEHSVKLNSKSKTSISSPASKMLSSQKAPKGMVSTENPRMQHKDSALREKKMDTRDSLINKRITTSVPSGEVQRKQIGGKIHPPLTTKSAVQAGQNLNLGLKTQSGKGLHVQNSQRIKNGEVLHQRPRDVPSSHSLSMKQIPSKDKTEKKLSSQNGSLKQCPPRNVPKQQSLCKDPPMKQFPPKDFPVKQFPRKDSCVRQFPPRDLQVKKFPPSDIPARQFPPRDIHMFKRPIKMPLKRRIESDEEEEMDDFIDDGPCAEDEDYSKHIREIFGYDKRRYMFEEDDLDNMESSFTQQMKEEAYSARMGLLEDLEDMKREEMEIVRKKRKLR